MNSLIHNVTIFTNNNQNAILHGHAVAIEDTRIKAVGTESDMQSKYAESRRLDGQGRLLMPGLINAHMHFYSTYARGLALPGKPANFHDILTLLWWKLDRALDLESVYYSALIPAITAIKSGVTAVIDHHASPHAVDGSLDRIENALSEVGLRGILCYEISDRDGKDIRNKGLVESERYGKKCRAARKDDPDYLFNSMIGLHASFTLEEESLECAAELSRSLEKGCHIHVLEDEVDGLITRANFQDGVVNRLFRFEILGEKTIAAHGVYLDEEEKDILAETNTIVVHNPQSNMNNAVGRADIFSLINRGIKVGIGTDAMSPDLKPDVRTANLLHKHDLHNSNAGWSEIQQMALKNNAEIYRRISGKPVGVIETGCLADLILVDYFPPTPLTGENFWGHFLFGIADAPVDTTIINGKIVMENKQLPGIDEVEIAAKSRQVAEKVWKRFYEQAVGE